MSIDWLRLGEYLVLALVAIGLLVEVRPRLGRWSERRRWARPWAEPLLTSATFALLIAPGLGRLWFAAPLAGVIMFGVWVAPRSIRRSRPGLGERAMPDD